MKEKIRIHSLISPRNEEEYKLYFTDEYNRLIDENGEPLDYNIEAIVEKEGKLY